MGKILGIIAVIALGVIGYMMLGSNKDKAAMPTDKKMAAVTTPMGEVKEFTTTAYYDETGVWYSLKEMRVKQGDTVRIKATNTKGMHDLIIDEFGVQKELPMNEEVVIEFVADKTGEFIYYCSKPGHRAKGQWGTLIVE